MKTIFAIIFAAACAALYAAPNVTNTVLMVDQHGDLNVEGVASVADIATNSVKVSIAEAKAQAAQETAVGVTNAIQGVVGNIMSNNVVVYRSGFADSFVALVIYTDNDILLIKEARWLERSASQIRVEIDYCCTADIGATKPIVMHRNTLAGIESRADFAELADGNVTTPTYSAGEVVIGGQTYAGVYTITATVPNPVASASYFLWIKVSGDTPGGDGATLDLPNGVTGGITGDVVWGDKTLVFKGGVLTGVRNE